MTCCLQACTGATPAWKQLQEALTTSGEALHETNGILFGETNQNSQWPHWSIIVLGGNALIGAISSVALGIFNQIPQCVAFAVSALASIVGCITIWTFTPLKSLEGFVSQMAERIKLLTDTVLRLNKTQKELKETIVDYTSKIHEQKVLFESEQKKFAERIKELDSASKQLQVAEKNALEIGSMVEAYKTRSADWKKKLDLFLESGKNYETSTAQLENNLKMLNSKESDLNQSLLNMGDTSKELNAVAIELHDASELFRGSSLQSAALLVQFRKEREEANKQIDELRKTILSLSKNTQEIKGARHDLEETQGHVKEQLDHLDKIIKMVNHKIDEKKMSQNGPQEANKPLNPPK